MFSLRDFLPFTADPKPRRPLRAWWELPARAPFVAVFLTAAWVIFLNLVRGNGWIYDNVRHHVGFIPELWTTDPARAFVVANVGLIVQHSWGQMIYISLLVLLVAIPYELRYGPLRTMALFYGASLTGVMVLTGIVITTAINGPHAWSHHIATTSWSGASVGCFGVMGAAIATARKPWLLMGAWGVYEIFIEWGMVPGLAVGMHVAGFLFGFTAGRVMAPAPTKGPSRVKEPTPGAVSADDEPET